MNAPLPGREQAEIDAAERPVLEQQLARRRPEGQASERADHTEPDHDEEQAAHAGAELVAASGARERGQLRQQRRPAPPGREGSGCAR